VNFREGYQKNLRDRLAGSVNQSQNAIGTASATLSVELVELLRRHWSDGFVRVFVEAIQRDILPKQAWPS